MILIKLFNAQQRFLTDSVKSKCVLQNYFIYENSKIHFTSKIFLGTLPFLQNVTCP